MNIEIESRESIEERVQKPFPANTALISITDRKGEFIELNHEPDYLLQLKFDDVIEGEIFSDFRAEKIAGFIKSEILNADLLICQCEYGQSRSAGIAAAVRQYLYGDGIEIFADERYYPNKLVYKKILAALEKNKE